MITVHFHEVGRNHLSWSLQMKEPTEAAILRAIRKKKALCSRVVWLDGQYICTGRGVVGRYTIVRDNPHEMALAV